MRVRGILSLPGRIFGAALCAAILLAGFGAGHAALNYRIKPGAFTSTAKNLRLFWGGAAQQLHGRLRSDKTLLQLASPRALRVLETAQEGQNLAFYEYLPAKYRRRPWLFLELEPRAQLDLIERGISAASNGLAKKAPGILRKAERAAREFGPKGMPSDFISEMLNDAYSNIKTLESNPVYLDQPVRERIAALRSPDFGKPAPWKPVLARSKPALEKVWYAKAVSAEHRALFEESLRRRKSPWSDELKRVGVDSKSPLAPRLKVRQSEARGSSGDVAFTVEWAQGALHAGAFRAVVRAKDAAPELHKIAAPKPPLDRQIVLRFRKDASPEDVARFLEAAKLRIIDQSFEGVYLVAVTGRESARAAARAITGKEPVLYASAKSASIPGTRQLRLVLRKQWVVPGAGLKALSEGALAEILSIPGLAVLKEEQDGSYLSYLIGVSGRGLDAFLADGRLSHRALFFVERPGGRARESQQLILRVKPRPLGLEAAPLAAWEDGVREIFAGQGIQILEQITGDSFRVASAQPLPLVLGRLRKAPHVESAVRVGALADEAVEASIRSARESSRGGRRSQSSYNESNFYERQRLALAGATRAQLARYDAAVEEAGRAGEFNNYAGD